MGLVSRLTGCFLKCEEPPVSAGSIPKRAPRGLPLLSGVAARFGFDRWQELGTLNTETGSVQSTGNRNASLDSFVKTRLLQAAEKSNQKRAKI